MYRLLSPAHIHGLQVLIKEVEEHVKHTALGAIRSLTGDNVSVLSLVTM